MSLTADLTRQIGSADLTMGQFGVLEALLHLGPMCQQELGAKLLRSGSNITIVIDNLEKRGEFPQHFMLTPRCAVWFEAEVDAWLDERMAAPATSTPAPDVALRKSSRGRVALEVRA